MKNFRATYIESHRAPNNDVHTVEVYTDPEGDIKENGIAVSKLVNASRDTLKALIQVNGLIQRTLITASDKAKTENLKQAMNICLSAIAKAEK